MQALTSDAASVLPLGPRYVGPMRLPILEHLVSLAELLELALVSSAMMPAIGQASADMPLSERKSREATSPSERANNASMRLQLALPTALAAQPSPNVGGGSGHGRGLRLGQGAAKNHHREGPTAEGGRAPSSGC